jgi:hypothetical protein
MNAAYDPSAWSNFFVAEAGASAALTGLIIVAVSINLNTLLKTSALSGRAAETVALLTGVLVLASFGVVPGQPLGVLGAEFVAVGLVLAIGNTMIRWQLGRHPKEPRRLREIIVYGASLPPIVAGVSLIAGSGGGLYWLVPGVIIALVGCVLNTWVLLVEILR